MKNHEFSVKNEKIPEKIWKKSNFTEKLQKPGISDERLALLCTDSTFFTEFLEKSPFHQSNCNFLSSKPRKTQFLFHRNAPNARSIRLLHKKMHSRLQSPWLRRHNRKRYHRFIPNLWSTLRQPILWATGEIYAGTTFGRSNGGQNIRWYAAIGIWWWTTDLYWHAIGQITNKNRPLLATAKI